MRSAGPPRRRPEGAPPPGGIRSGEREPIFVYLPEEVRQNMQRPDSESALLWSEFYPFAHAGLSIEAWNAVRPLWGSPGQTGSDDRLIPYFWGLRVDGTSLDGLAKAAEAIAGREDRLEVDLFLVGERNLIVVEAKAGAEPGRCGRYELGACPEIHGGGDPCRYWHGAVTFVDHLEFGARPEPGAEEIPPCARHYQLARTLMIAGRLGRESGRVPHLCLIVPRRRWKALQPQWLDFVERVRDDSMWRRMRVVAWEDLGALTRPKA